MDAFLRQFVTSREDDEGVDLLDTLDHLDTEGSTVTLKSRGGEPVVIWVDDLNSLDAYLEGEA